MAAGPLQTEIWAKVARALQFLLRETRIFVLRTLQVIAGMQALAEAHAGILFCPPANVAAEFPQFPVTRSYELRQAIIAASKA